MKLTDLEPVFVQCTEKGYREVSTLGEAQGVRFLCPAGHGHGILVWFAERGVPCAAVPGPGRWSVLGSSLADLSLSPSIQLGHGCGWHGFITDGKVTSC